MAAELRFEHEFTIGVPLQEAWPALADAGAVAVALPAADLRAVDGIHTGRIGLDAGRNLVCEATITGVDQDEDEHVATVAIHGRQLDGPGIGSAVLRSRLWEHEGSTKVRLTAEVLTTGHARGNGFEAAARGIFQAVAEGLERQARDRPPAAVATPPPAETLSAASAPVVPRHSPLDRIGGPKRLIAGAAGLMLAAALLRRLGRGSR